MIFGVGIGILTLIATITTIIKILKFNNLIRNIKMNLLIDLPLINSTINF